MADGPFQYDVFLSHSSKDKPVVRDLAERLKRDGVRVWFDEWIIRPGDNIPSKIEEGLERSRILILCMSQNAFGSDWSALENQTFRFRDPLNKDLRFIPLRLDAAEPRGTLAQFAFVDWRVADKTAPYRLLLKACKPQWDPSHSEPDPSATNERRNEAYRSISLGHTNHVRSVAWSPDGGRALSASDDKTVRLWDPDSGQCIRILEDHSDKVSSVTWSPDGRRALSASDDKTVRLWDPDSGQCLRILEGHSSRVWSVAWSPDGRGAFSAS